MPGARKPIVRSDWKRVAALGLLWFAFPMSMFPHAEQWISSALTGMLNGTVPLFATAVAAVLHRRWPPAMVAVGIAAGLFGGVLMAWPGLGAGGNSALGIVLVIAACISYGFAVNLARPLQQRNGALPVVWRALLVALILTAPLGLPRALHGHWTPRAVLSLLALGALGTCVANVMTTIAAGRLGATSASVSAYFIPVVALLLGVLVRNEHVARAVADRRRGQPGGGVGRALGVDAGGRGRAGRGGHQHAAAGEVGFGHAHARTLSARGRAARLAVDWWASLPPRASRGPGQVGSPEAGVSRVCRRLWSWLWSWAPRLSSHKSRPPRRRPAFRTPALSSPGRSFGTSRRFCAAGACSRAAGVPGWPPKTCVRVEFLT